MSKVKARPEVCYCFSRGGVTLECGILDDGIGKVRALRSEGEYQQWRERNPEAVTWRTIDGARVAD